MPPRIAWVFAACLACDTARAGPAAGGGVVTLGLSSSSFAAQGDIPAKQTCEGGDVSPALAWTGAPATTKSFALIVDDPDAPDPRAPKTTWVHWVAYDIPSTVSAIPEGATDAALVGKPGKNDWGAPGYRGPCPPVGRHRYFHKLYALDVVLPDLATPDKAALERAMQGHVVGQATLIGTYQKKS
jgi:Raf kinase inhibitor-like YbhB/YbcL family protein